MTKSCPHCGAQLRVSSDPFCGECRQAVDELPAAPLTREQARAGQLGTAKVLKYLGWFFLIGGIIAAGMNPAKVRGSVESFVDLAFIVAGAGLLVVSYWLGRREKSASQHAIVEGRNRDL